MEEELKKHIQQLMTKTQCDNGFRCCKSDFKNLCKATIIGDGQLIDCTTHDTGSCLRESPKSCSHRIPFGFGHFCSCPIRIFTAKHPGISIAAIGAKEAETSTEPVLPQE